MTDKNLKYLLRILLLINIENDNSLLVKVTASQHYPMGRQGAKGVYHGENHSKTTVERWSSLIQAMPELSSPLFVVTVVLIVIT